MKVKLYVSSRLAKNVGVYSKRMNGRSSQNLERMESVEAVECDNEGEYQRDQSITGRKASVLYSSPGRGVLDWHGAPDHAAVPRIRGKPRDVACHLVDDRQEKGQATCRNILG